MTIDIMNEGYINDIGTDIGQLFKKVGMRVGQIKLGLMIAILQSSRC